MRIDIATLALFLVEVGSDDEDAEGEQTIGKKKVISIPLRFKPIEVPRGPAGSFGPRGGRGQRRGDGGSRYQERTNRDEQGTGKCTLRTQFTDTLSGSSSERT